MNPTGPCRLLLRWLLLAATLMALGGCAVGPDRRDPLEPFNRGVMRFNDELDNAIVKPAAVAYRDTVPAPARTAVNNVFSNLGDFWSLANSLLQLRLQHAAETFLRVSINSTFGLYGLIDVAGELGLERHREDFGQTLGRWGVPPGPFLVLPLVGPSTVRDSVGFLVDRQGDPVREVNPAGSRTALYALRALDHRTSLLRVSRVLDEVALDRYTFTRDAYLQRRRAEIFDGLPALGDEDDEPKDE